MMTGNRPPIDSLLLRKSLGCFPTGVIVVTTLGDDGMPVGMTINSFSSVSLDPPLVLWNIALDAPSLGAFREHPGFTLNILSEQQQSVCQQFAKPAQDKFKGIEWKPGYEGTPVISGALAVIQCKPYQRYEGGDHEIILGEVVNIASTEEKPLVYNRGQFAALAEQQK